MKMVQPLLVALTLIGLTQSGLSAVVQTSQYSTNIWSSIPWSSRVSSTDLINYGQSSLSSYDAPDADYSVSAGMNDGSSTLANLTDNTFYLTTFPVVATYNLNISINTLGYDITSIESFMGWHEHTLSQANQIYTVEVRTVGSSDYTLLETVNYAPFSDITGAYHYSHVEITEDGAGILASGVDSIRFTFSNPGSEGAVIRELDVYGSPTVVPEPASLSLIVVIGAVLYAFRRTRYCEE